VERAQQGVTTPVRITPARREGLRETSSSSPPVAPALLGPRPLARGALSTVTILFQLAGSIEQDPQAARPTGLGSTRPRRQNDPTALGSKRPRRQNDPTALGSKRPRRQNDPTALGSKGPPRQNDPTGLGSKWPRRQVEPNRPWVQAPSKANRPNRHWVRVPSEVNGAQPPSGANALRGQKTESRPDPWASRGTCDLNPFIRNGPRSRRERTAHGPTGPRRRGSA